MSDLRGRALRILPAMGQGALLTPCPREPLSILLVQPRWRGLGNRKKIKVAESRVHPLSVGIVAAVARRHHPGHRITVVDEANRPVPFAESFDLVGISVNTYTAPGAFEIADRFRGRGVPVLLGGCHASLDPADCERHADAVLVGEGSTRSRIL
jgi:hypothetical protein